MKIEKISLNIIDYFFVVYKIQRFNGVNGRSSYWNLEIDGFGKVYLRKVYSQFLVVQWGESKENEEFGLRFFLFFGFSFMIVLV